MTVLALGFIPGGAYAALDGVKTFVEEGNQNVKIGNGISLRNNNGKNGAVAIGDHVQIDDYVMQEGSVAIGKNAFVENLYGNQEKNFKFNQQDLTKWASSIAIGQNAYARSGSTMIGDHKYIGKLGDTEVDGSNVLNVKSKNVNINAIIRARFPPSSGRIRLFPGNTMAVTGHPMLRKIWEPVL